MNISMKIVYKVIKGFAALKKGDMFIFDGKSDMWVMKSENEECRRVVRISDSIAQQLCEDGYLIMVVLTNDKPKTAEDKITTVNKFIDEKIAQYDNDYNEVIEKYENGGMPTCVKVEAETVYFNMVKMLNKIKELVNE